jgi:hypothetical protein
MGIRDFVRRLHAKASTAVRASDVSRVRKKLRNNKHVRKSAIAADTKVKKMRLPSVGPDQETMNGFCLKAHLISNAVQATSAGP